MNELLFIGHSHVAAVQMAAKALGRNDIVTLNFWDLQDGIIDGRLSDDIAERIANHEGPVCSMIAGNGPIIIGALVHPRKFDFVLPSRPDMPLDADAEILPSGMVMRKLEEIAEPYISLMGQVR